MAAPGLKLQQDDDARSVIDVCGKRTLDYVIECLAKFNSSSTDRISIRAIGGNISKGVGVAQLLVKKFGFAVQSSQIGTLEICDSPSSCLEMRLQGPTTRPSPQQLTKCSPDQKGFIDFPLYHLLFDTVLSNSQELRVGIGSRTQKQNNSPVPPTPLLTLKPGVAGFSCSACTNPRF